MSSISLSLSDPEVWAQIFTATCAILGIFFVGKRYWWGWLFNLANGLGWGVLIWFSGQVIMYIPLVLMLALALRNCIEWYAEGRRQKADEDG